ncbi:hypothetical protein BBJ28_00000898 [Nothophytophthora sp. Chile5]|nr:hypothetical protein BBJ28_00000898 [Nothophytophthora sp. Chile5]
MSRHGAPPPPPSNPNVTCRACGCLNFSQREICDSCRSRAPVFRRTVRQSAAIREVGASSNGHLKASSVAPQRASQTNGGSDRRHAGSHGGRDERHSSSAGRKRRFGENGERSSAASAERSGSKATADSQQRRIPPTAKKQPEIIDLLSSSDDEAEDTAQVAASLDTSRSTAKTAATSRSRNERQRTTTGKAPTTSEAFQSRVFPSVEFVARDFPTVEVAAAARKASGQSGGQSVAVGVKKHPLGDAVKEEPQRSVSADTAAATNPAGSSAQTPARRVKAPLLGHCSADFLELMREFGDEDADDDPEEAQWALLDVVDLTSLSDSEGNDSDAESSISSPTNPLRQPVANAAEGAGQSTAVSTAGGSSTTSQHAPGPDAVPRQPYRPEKVDCELCGESGSANRLIRCPTCTKYYHRKCAREQGDATKCWNCELGMMIDDSDLTEEDKERQAEYTSAFRHYPTAEESGDDVGEEEGDVEMAEASVSSTPFSEATRTNKSNQRWKAFMEEDTADIDASFDAVTARITLELRTEEARNKYTKGFATREELDAQLAELEEFYIEEQERLERQRAKEKEKAMAAASASGNSEQREGGGAEAAGSSVREEGGDSEAVAPADASSNTGMTATSPSSSSLQVEAPPPVAPVPAAPPPSMSE